MSSANRCTAGSNGPRRQQRGGVGGEAGADRPADAHRAAGAPRLEPLAQPRAAAARAAAAPRAARPRSRAAGARSAAPRPRRAAAARAARRARRRRSPRGGAGASSSSSQSGLSRTVTSACAAATPALHAAPKPGLSRRSITSAPHAAAASAPPSCAARVDDHDLRPLAEPGVERAQQRRQLGGGVVQHDDDRVGHGAPP